MNRNFNTYMAIGNPSTICSSKAKATSTTTKDQGYVMRRSFIIITTLDRTNFCRENNSTVICQSRAFSKLVVTLPLLNISDISFYGPYKAVWWYC